MLNLVLLAKLVIDDNAGGTIMEVNLFYPVK